MTDNAKTALAALRDSDHPFGRPLALCLMFEPANDQSLAASIFDLAIALDSALHIPSESLLAAIRVQWWVDALSDSTAQTAPLVPQLHAQKHAQTCRMRQWVFCVGRIVSGNRKQLARKSCRCFARTMIACPQ